MTPDPHTEHRRAMQMADDYESFANSLLSASDNEAQRISNRAKAARYKQAARDLRARAERQFIKNQGAR